MRVTPPTSHQASASVAPRVWHARFFDLAPAAASLSRATDGRFVEVNEAFLHLYGYERDEVLGRTSLDLRMWPDAGARKQMADLVLATGAVRSFVIESRMKNGERRRLLLSAEVVEDEGEPCFLAILQDVTQQERARADIERLAAELQRSNAELEQFAYVAAHDLRSPLRHIAGYAQLLGETPGLANDADARELVARLARETERMTALVARLLESSRVERAAVALAPVDTRRLVEDVVATLSEMVQETAARVTLGALPVVRADETQLREVVQNLVENALKFRASGRAPEIHVDAIVAEREWTFRVRDNGIGIAPADAERLFHMFTRLHAHEAFPGSGIGLALSKRIVERHGGRMWVESEPDKGSTFCFTLPRPA